MNNKKNNAIFKSTRILFKLALTLISLCASNTLLYAQSSDRQKSENNFGFFQKLDFNFSVMTQSHQSNFDWSIAADMTGEKGPNTLSELEYEALDLQLIRTNFISQYPLNAHWKIYLSLDISNGQINNGQVIDSDYSGNNKTQPRSISQSDPSGSSVNQQEFSIGLIKELSTGTQLGFEMGLAQQSQSFVKRNGFQLYSEENANTPSAGTTLSNLNSTYQSQWDSQFLGFNIQQPLGKHSILLKINYHLSDYYAHADWNLRKNFQHPKSFEHLAKGKGMSTALHYMIPMFDYWHLNFSVHHEKWRTSNGIDRLFLVDGSSPTTRLNQATWDSLGYGIGLRYFKDF